MKKTFNIKKIMFIVIMFICFFACNNRVEAEEPKYVCYYVPPFVDTNNYYVEIKYFDSGFYDINLHNITTGVSAKSFGQGEDTYAISNESGYEMSKHAFEAGCPDVNILDFGRNEVHDDVYVDIFHTYNSMNPYLKTYHPQFDIAAQGGGQFNLNDKKEMIENGNFARLLSSSGVRVYDWPNHSKDDGGGKSEDKVTCSYDMKWFKSERTVSLTLTYYKNSTDKPVLKTFNGSFTPISEFDVSQLNGECPSHLYASETDGNTGERHFYLNESNNAKLDYKIVKTTKIETEEQNLTPCQRLGGTVKYLKILYKFLKYAIPTLIIVFSTFEFLGVVFSGDDEKMEKAKKHFVNRLIIGIVILLVPVILETGLRMGNVINKSEDLSDVACGIFEK